MKNSNYLYEKSIFIFRRDLRLEDNLGLLHALENSKQVLAFFIFDKRQANPKENKYFSKNAFQFMVESLKELESALKKRGATLQIVEGNYLECLGSAIDLVGANAVFVNKDYTPFALERDSNINALCEKKGITFVRVADYTLSPIEDIVTGQGKKYSVFTPFMHAAKKYDVIKPQKNKYDTFSNKARIKKIKGSVQLSQYDIYKNTQIASRGGRSRALEIMKDGSFIASYAKRRDVPAVDGTSRLSAHLKFGTVSIREVYHFAQNAHTNPTTFINELYWRDFYMYISYHYQSVYKKSFQKRGEHIKWINNRKQFKAWCEGKTGVPFIDAGMRQLNATGWMHNRVRMAVASYLTKNLLVDWRWGEKYFAQKLVDYDPSSNNGGWQWSASVGADPKPIRIFNPYTQAQKFDGEALYMKKWLPELKDIDTELLTDGKERDFSSMVDGYPAPLVDQKKSFHRAMEAFRQAKAEN